MDTNFDLTPSKKGPSLRVCYLCGRSFGLTSYPFHITTCKELFVRREKGEKELPDDPNPSNAEELCTLEEINANALDFYNAMVCSKCDHCFRTFFREQLVKHNKYCTAANPFKRLSAGMSERSLSTIEASPRSPRRASADWAGRMTPSKSAFKPAPFTKAHSTMNRRFEASKTSTDLAAKLAERRDSIETVKRNLRERSETIRERQVANGLKTRTCYLCGRSFGQASYPFHIPTCFELAAKNMGVNNVPVYPFTDTMEKELSFEELNKLARNVFDEKMCSKCVHCDRTFVLVQLVKHAKYCSADKPVKGFSFGRSSAESVMSGGRPSSMVVSRPSRPPLTTQLSSPALASPAKPTLPPHPARAPPAKPQRNGSKSATSGVTTPVTTSVSEDSSTATSPEAVVRSRAMSFSRKIAAAEEPSVNPALAPSTQHSKATPTAGPRAGPTGSAGSRARHKSLPSALEAREVFALENEAGVFLTKPPHPYRPPAENVPEVAARNAFRITNFIPKMKGRRASEEYKTATGGDGDNHDTCVSSNSFKSSAFLNEEEMRRVFDASSQSGSAAEEESPPPSDDALLKPSMLLRGKKKIGSDAEGKNAGCRTS